MALLDRYGQPLEDQAAEDGHRCANGWRGADAEDRPIPCLVCRPHLAPQVSPSPSCSLCGARPKDPPGLRMLELDDGSVTRCPDCHPSGSAEGRE